ncbi:hypothetical protein NIES267_26140 [Calothrix parasitica NIES-267]|uniref:Uncharacterized protein n=1 Tax=Calothrix parasitica NIES-267 TaxID=1973488 RepID=A0A1Z4LPV7_9CYAN|nr:hypothetical protein NIES267_26140 [Calothrix parasitica NIES-267]
MSFKTIQCRLVAEESTRQQLWQLMAHKNTPLINELLLQVAQHPDFETWRKKGKIAKGIITQLCQSLKTDLRFIGQPGRFYTSAITFVDCIYKSWLELMKLNQRRLEGKNRWQKMLKSDAELVEDSSASLDLIRSKATEILAQAQLNSESLSAENQENNKSEKSIKKQKKGKKKNNKKSEESEENKSLSKALFDAYENTEDILTRCAISYLLKNGCKVTNKEEDPEKFTIRRRKLEIEIEDLQEKLEARLPKARDLTDSSWLNNLELATKQVPESEEEAKSWQDALLKKSSSVPFPIAYETNEDMTWFKNEKGRICVKFNGIGEHTFEIYCNKRQLHWFKRFLLDQETKKNSNDQYSSSLFTLRSGLILWQERDKKGKPWNINYLALHCCVDTRLWTAEGTQVVAEEKAEEITRIISNAKKKDNLNKNQLTFIKRKKTTLARINNPYPRPSKPLYKGQSNIILGLYLGLKERATIAVVDVNAGKVLINQSTKQLLGNNYRLIDRQRRQKRKLSHQRKIAQTQSKPNNFKESDLGEYIDRLLAKKIVEIAQKFSASSIVLPKLTNMREQINSEIQAKAEKKCPESIEVQKKYAHQYRINLNNWSYGRLTQNIQNLASQVGLTVEENEQPLKGSPKEKAKELALVAYKARNKS